MRKEILAVEHVETGELISVDAVDAAQESPRLSKQGQIA
jgi:hypothetical protein